MKTHTFLFALPVLFFLSCAGTSDSDAGNVTNDGPFTIFTLEKRISGGETSGADLSFNLVDAKSTSLQRLIRGLLYGGAGPEKYARDILGKWEKSYGEFIAESAAQGESYDQDWDYTEEHGFVSAGSFAVISRLISTYEGGAHPNYTAASFVIDLEKLRQLGVNDIITKEGSSNLYTFVDRELRLFSEEQTGEKLPPGEPLSKGIFFEDEIPPLTNINPKPEGLSFHWDPYAAAPYSVGIVEVTIPWDELDGLLSPRGRDLAAAFRDIPRPFP
jgi:hypothetical protein